VPNFVHRSNRYPDIAIFDSRADSRPSSWIFKSLADRVPWRGSKCIIVPNFAAIGRTLAEIWLGHFLIFQDGGRRHLGFLKRQTFNGRTRQEGRTASPCQILSKSLNVRPTYGDFSTFQYGGRRHLGFLNF